MGVLWLPRQVLCPKEVQRLVVRHGQVLQAAAAAEVQELLARPERAALAAQWVPARPPRRPAAWPQAVQEKVLAALAVESPTPPEGVSPADWEQVLAVRRAEAATPLATLARLGPELAPEQILVTADGVLVRQPAKKSWGEVQTACVVTPQGYRFLCGVGELFLQQLWLLLLLAGGMRGGLVTFISDGARWLREFAQEHLSRLPRRELLLDWFHLVKKVRDRISRMGGSRSAKKRLRQGMHWNLITSGALAFLKVLQLNHDWEAYWAEGVLPSLVGA